jgi:hypothetical protein
VKQVGAVTEADRQHVRQKFYRRPDGSLTHWDRAGGSLCHLPRLPHRKNCDAERRALSGAP